MKKTKTSKFNIQIPKLSLGGVFAILPIVLMVLVVSLILSGYVKGYLENPTTADLLTPKWIIDGPLQLSPDRGRFALLYSVAEDKSFSFSTDLARFTTPDLGYINGKYVSLFAPAVSFALIPGYVIGKMFGASQVGAYSVIAMFALANLVLIYAISRTLGFKKGVGLFAGLMFLFATPAFAYSVNLYQHHISTFIILLSLLLLFRYKSFWSLLLIFALCAVSIPVDYPNLFMMAPIGIAAFMKTLVMDRANGKTIIGINLLKILSLIGVMPGLAFFFWFNYVSYGNPMQFSGTVSSVKAIDADGHPVAPSTLTAAEASEFNNPEEQSKDAVGFFETRLMLNGLYTHFISPDRGIIYFTPIVLLAIFGFIVAVKQNKYATLIISAVLLMNIVLYSMWGDPWGGWAFGSRYLIPAYAMAAMLFGFALNKYFNKIWLLLPLFIIFSYSVYINSLGAITSIANPPQPEVLSLEAQTGKVQKYTSERNLDGVMQDKTNSVMYNTFFRGQINVYTYNVILVGAIIVLGILVLSFDHKKEQI